MNEHLQDPKNEPDRSSRRRIVSALVAVSIVALAGSCSFGASGGAEGEATEEVAPRGDGPAADVLRLRCTREGTSVLTPTVAAQQDGVRVVVLPVGSAQPVEFRELGTGSRFGGTIAADGSSHPWPIAPGPAKVACGNEASGSANAQPFEVVDPAGHWAEPLLSCEETDRAEVVGYDGGAAGWVSEEAAIEGILVGVLPDDRVMPPLYGRDRLDRWVIVRDGDVVGIVMYTTITEASDPRSGGLGRVDGDVCASSGIEGTVPPRDPDEDGVDLDCKAGSQVAFRHQGGVDLPAGEAFITTNVPGIRASDEVVPPDGVDGTGGWDGIWTVVREGKRVASIDYPALDGITCRWNAIGTPVPG